MLYIAVFACFLFAGMIEYHRKMFFVTDGFLQSTAMEQRTILADRLGIV